MVRRLFFFLTALVLLLTACSDNDSFTTDPSHRLTFSRDTVRMDTLFSGVPSTTYTFWAFNNSGDGIRIRTVRLDRGNQSGFRVNVDGTYLNPVANDFEVRKGDSIRIFVEVTTLDNQQAVAQLVEDNVLFTLESGVEQRVNLRTYSWDATPLTDKEVTQDETLESSKPVIVYGKGITVSEGATLTIRNTTLYFHDGAGIHVSGKLVLENVLLRGDRLDHMFDYLPYDRVSGQWEGITLAEQAEGLVMTGSELHSALTGVLARQSKVEMSNSVIHNCKGHGLYAFDSTVSLSNSLISNTQGDCLSLHGCQAIVDASTLAQFYPFNASRGAALRFATTEQPMILVCANTLVTGYEDDVVMGEGDDNAPEKFDYYFENSLLRTPAVDDADRFKDVVWELPANPFQGKMHFLLVDENNLIYDFHLKEDSPAVEKQIGWTGSYRTTTTTP